MQKKTLFIVLTALLLSLPITAMAASPSPSATSSSDSLNDVTENIKKRLQDTLDNPSSSSKPTALRAYVGIVRDVIKDTVVIEDKDGKKNVVISDKAIILRSPGNATIKPEDIRIDDSIIAIGPFLGEDELSGLRLIVSTAALPTSNKVVGFGVISKIGKSSLSLSGASGDVELITNTKTVLKSTTSLSLDLTDLSVGDTLIYIASVEDKVSTAKSIMRIKTTSASPNP